LPWSSHWFQQILIQTILLEYLHTSIIFTLLSLPSVVLIETSFWLINYLGINPWSMYATHWLWKQIISLYGLNNKFLSLYYGVIHGHGISFVLFINLRVFINLVHVKIIIKLRRAHWKRRIISFNNTTIVMLVRLHGRDVLRFTIV